MLLCHTYRRFIDKLTNKHEAVYFHACLKNRKGRSGMSFIFRLTSCLITQRFQPRLLAARQGAGHEQSYNGSQSLEPASNSQAASSPARDAKMRQKGRLAPSVMKRMKPKPAMDMNPGDRALFEQLNGHLRSVEEMISRLGFSLRELQADGLRGLFRRPPVGISPRPKPRAYSGRGVRTAPHGLHS